jgi:NADH-quinone oxidoreductase subunit C
MTGAHDAEGRRGHLVRIVTRRLGAHVYLSATSDSVEDVFVIERDHLIDLTTFLRDDRDAALDMLVSLTAIDPVSPGPSTRFVLVVRLRSSRLAYRARIECPLPKDDPTFASLTSLYGAADWLEREVHDLFGLFPDGHPFVRRLILYPGFAGHPLRRDYPMHKSQPLVPLREPARAAIVIDASTTTREGGA